MTPTAPQSGPRVREPSARSVPGRIPARQARSRRTEERLLAAAERVFVRDGLERATVARLCEVAGVGVGTFYGRFRDKDTLVAAYFAEYYRRASEHLEREFPIARWRGKPAAAITSAWIDQRVRRFRQGRALTRAILTYTRAQPNAAFRSAVAGYSALVVDRFSELIENATHAGRHPSPRRAAVVAVSAVEALLKELAIYGDIRSKALAIADDELVPELTRMIHGYLGLPSSEGGE